MTLWCRDHTDQCPYGTPSSSGTSISYCARVDGHSGQHMLPHLESATPDERQRWSDAYRPHRWVLRDEFERVMIATGEWQP